MSFILGLANRDQVIQISDRRVSLRGKPLDDESAKGIYLLAGNARVAVGFAGLAAAGSFVTRDWLLKTLLECGPPDFTLGGIVKRLCDRATTDFSSTPALRRTRPPDRRLSILLSGYLTAFDPPFICHALATNYQDYESRRDAATAWNRFVYWTTQEKRPVPAGAEVTAIQRIGLWQAMTESDVRILRRILEERKPGKYIVDRACALVREMADRPIASGAIGKQLTSISIPADPSQKPTSGYHVARARDEYVMCDVVAVKSDGLQLIMKDASFGEATSPIAIPRVGRNQPCPCGSARKYKKCHGSPGARKYRLVVDFQEKQPDEDP